MNFPFAPFGQWDDLNEKLKIILGLTDPRVHARLAKGSVSALHSSVESLSALFTMQKSAFFIQGCFHYSRLISQTLAAKGFQVAHITSDVLAQPEEFVKNLPKDTLFVLMSSDQLVTGRKFDVSRLSSLLADKKIYSICLGNHDFPEVHPFMIQIRTYHRELSAVIFGSRAKVDIPLQEYFIWSERDIDLIQKQNRQLNRSAILDFERQTHLGFVPFFHEKDEMRIFDRAVVVMKEVDGWALCEALSEELQIKLAEPGEEMRLETTSLCRWGGVQTMDWIKNAQVTSDTVRGMVVISLAILERADFSVAFANALKSVLKLQS